MSPVLTGVATHCPLSPSRPRWPTALVCACISERPPLCVWLHVFYAVQPKMCDTLVDALERVFADNLVGEPFDFLGRNGDEYRR